MNALRAREAGWVQPQPQPQNVPQEAAAAGSHTPANSPSNAASTEHEYVRVEPTNVDVVPSPVNSARSVPSTDRAPIPNVYRGADSMCPVCQVNF